MIHDLIRGLFISFGHVKESLSTKRACHKDYSMSCHACLARSDNSQDAAMVAAADAPGDLRRYPVCQSCPEQYLPRITAGVH